MNIFHAIILGVIQGIGEFLPISSSAHLILIPYLFNWSEHSLSFDVALHFGTLIAVLFVYFNEWWKLFKGAYNKIVHKKNSFENRMFWYLVIATIPGALIGKIFEEPIENVLRTNYALIAIALGVMGILIYLGDKWAAKKYDGKETEYKDLTLKQTFLIGLSQALAVIPGFSRSGSGKPHKDKVAKVTTAQCEEIAKTKMQDLNASSLETAVSMIKGTARSMGIEVID